jgi:hypothetical protein
VPPGGSGDTGAEPDGVPDVVVVVVPVVVVVLELDAG